MGFSTLLPACLSRQCLSESWVRGIYTKESADKFDLRIYNTQQAYVYLSDWVEWDSDSAKYSVIHSSDADKPKREKIDK